MKLSMKWTFYKPSRAVVIGFIVLSLLVCYTAQTFIKREFLSEVSDSIFFDKQNKLNVQGIIYSVAKDQPGEINAFLFNPLVNWKPPVIMFVILIGIGAGIIFIRSKIIGLERDSTDSGRKIKELEDDINWKNRNISELRTDVQNKADFADDLRKKLTQYREAYEATKLENATIKEQCQAALAKKDQEHEKNTGDLKKFFANELYNAKNPPAGPVQTEDNSI